MVSQLERVTPYHRLSPQEKVGLHIELQRERFRKISQQDLADALSVSRSLISKWESGAIEVEVWRLGAIAEALGCNQEELLA